MKDKVPISRKMCMSEPNYDIQKFTSDSIIQGKGGCALSTT